ncbi:NAD-dependent epimerase/dehydratase family protein [Azospirillum agricola]|uniref:NAD-dependent epimerase/dehydratase family protein n=1 Tax=Azospirillum agricola TaxID=1720247 RepID=UPI000A0F09CF|nr:NAD(P)-dependent oxidoreductase [Azospirillum agricola]SMH41702.1 Nucleoside-diphosphate-sugar epimerase [Azospirillum lipoferum]
MADSKSILVTGGAGYLGSILVPALLDGGHKVTVLDSFLFRQVSLAHVCAHPNFDVVRGDARSEDVLKPLLKSADVVIPLAALVGAPLCDADMLAATSTNRDAVLTLVRLLSREQRIMMPVTNSGYGIGETGKFCTEETPLRPISLYGRTKVEAEAAVLERGNALSFRLATVFGMAPRMRIDLLVNDFVHRAVNDRAVVLFEPHFKRNYIHIRDVARAFLHGLDRFETMKDRPYNVGLSDANLSKWELCAVIARHLPKFVYLEAPIGEDPDKRDYIVSNERIEATGYKPAFSLDDGIRELIKGYRMLRNGLYSNV